jgi:hypothetical protein
LESAEQFTVKRLRNSAISLEQARWTMAKVWFGGAGILIVLLIAQSFGTVYQGHIAEVWSWALPTVMPTLSLIIAVLKSSALEKDDNQDSKQPKVKRRFYFVALSLSVFEDLEDVVRRPGTAQQAPNNSTGWVFKTIGIHPNPVL